MDGGFFIRHLAFEGNYGMNCRYSVFSHDAAVMKREIIMMAGEWLERAGMLRGRYDDEQAAGHVEGMAKPKYADVKLVMPDGKPFTQYKLPEVFDPETAPFRKVPRPQVVKNGN